ncbi:MAG: response regulator, partial [Bacteroidia bacterium]
MNYKENLHAINILLVEDNPGDIRLTEEVLKEGKIQNNLSIVTDGEEAILFLKKQEKYTEAPTPDIILLDLNLPKKDGREVLAEIKTDPELMMIPVIVLTTSSAEQDVLNMYA